jgi:hypothetical protein
LGGTATRLVVETRNFKARSIYRNASAETMRLVERFRRTSPQTVEWDVTVDDAATWTRAVDILDPADDERQEPVLEYACHEGNHAITTSSAPRVCNGQAHGTSEAISVAGIIATRIRPPTSPDPTVPFRLSSIATVPLAIAGSVSNCR